MNYGFIRTCAAVPRITPGNCCGNAEAIIDLIREADNIKAALVVFPELCITGCTCADLFFQTALLREAEIQLLRIARSAKDLSVIAVAGFPFAYGNVIYNTAAVIHGGTVCALIPQSRISGYSELAGYRYFAPAFEGIKYADLRDTSSSDAGSVLHIPFGTNILIRDTLNERIAAAVEIGTDLQSCSPPSGGHAVSGALFIACPSASGEGAGEAEYRTKLVEGQSLRLSCAYIYSGAGEGESTTDLVFAGPRLIAENGTLIAASETFTAGLLTADVDTERLLQDRRRRDFRQTGEEYLSIRVPFRHGEEELNRFVDPFPFVPADNTAGRCSDIFAVQTAGLKKRLTHTGAKKAVLGLSGGLDSTLALLVTVRAFDELSLPRSGIITAAMAGFGTTGRTYTNSVQLAKALGTDLREIPICDAIMQHFRDIEHNPEERNAVYENSQARERTQILMDIANGCNALVIGTGDLSELALGWSTYNGDHMSMYAVNASVPKTLIQAIIRDCAMRTATPHCRALSGSAAEADSQRNSGSGKEEVSLDSILLDILNTPISPELLPPDKDTITQKTEDIVGPYELHDFFLYYMLRWGFGPKKICYLAEKAFRPKNGRNTVYERKVIIRWLSVFYRRFFSQQFKRSCMPDGPKTGSVGLSPRGEWYMPSDADGTFWIKEVAELAAE